MREQVTQCNSVTHWCVCNSLWTQLRSMAQMNKIYQVLATLAVTQVDINILMKPQITNCIKQNTQ